jgi:hypothetical protein
MIIFDKADSFIYLNIISFLIAGWNLWRQPEWLNCGIFNPMCAKLQLLRTPSVSANLL